MRGCRGAGALCAFISAGLPLFAHAAPVRCERIDQAVQALYATPIVPQAKVILGPIAPASVLPGLLRSATTSSGAASQASYLALGLSRHARGLKALRQLPPPPRSQKLSRALALLALGDGSGTGTVAWALKNGPVSQRRKLARALAGMEQVRPRRMLFEALLDEDPQVRLTAAEVQIKRYSRRARRVLRELMTQGPTEYVQGAARALFGTKIPFRSDEVARLPDSLKGPMQVRLHLSSRRRRAQSLRGKLPSRDPYVRAGAFAALAAAGHISPALLKRYAKVALASRGSTAEAQLRMALALLGDAESIETLVALQGKEARAAADVLWAFSGARAPYHRLDEGHARKIAQGVQSWLQRGFLDAERQAQMIKALYAADPVVGLGLARARLSGGSGPSWQAALEVVRKSGLGADADTLRAQLPKLDPVDAARALRVAREVCAR